MLWRLALGRKSVASGILSRASAVMTKLSDAQPRAQRPRLGPLLTLSQRTVPPSLCFVRVEPDASYSEDLRGRIDRPSQQHHHHLRSHRDELFTVSSPILYAGTVRLLSLLVEPIVGQTSERCLSSTDRRLHTATGGDEPSTLAIASSALFHGVLAIYIRFPIPNGPKAKQLPPRQSPISNRTHYVKCLPVSDLCMS